MDNNLLPQGIDLTLLDALSPAEKQLALSILKEYSESGESKSLHELQTEDYEEIPVDIETFLRDPNYLGQGTTNDEGKFTVFPYWVETLKKLFPNNLETAYNTLVLSGAIGIGKSFVAVLAMLYMLYRMLCLKDPYKHYGLQPIDHITFSLMNITLDAAKGVAWSKIQELLQLSPWFMAHGRVSKSLNPEWQPINNIELIFGSQPRHVIGRAVFCSFEDEISFQPNQDLEKQKKKARELVSSIDARMSSRFMHGTKLPTLHILASSKRSDQSFLETYIDTKKKNESKTTLIIDEPQWVIRTDKDSKEKFAVAVGNKFLESEVLPLTATEEDYQIYRDRGYTILMVPMGYHESFTDDINIALTDIAGISTSNSMNYISGVRWTRCRNDHLKNPFTREILDVGNGPDDTTQYYEFFDQSLISSEMKSRPLFIHLDMSISGDKTGIAGVWIKGKKPHQDGVPDSKELYYQLAFSVSIKAPKGRQISFEKNRQFIYWLREQGFNIKGVSYDTFNSVDLGQALTARGFSCDIISVDRVQDRICKPYLTFKNAIYEERIVTYPTKLLTAEIVGLVRDSNGKIDHTPSGINSKDQADAVCLRGDTKVFLLSGEQKTMSELYDEYQNNSDMNEWVLAYNTETGKMEPTKIEAVLNNGYKNNLIKLYLDNGESIICTRDHKILLRDGTYLEAENTLNKSLMPFTYENKTMYKNRDYAYVYNPNRDLTTTGIYLHKLVAESCHSNDKKNKENSKNPGEWVVIHHKDCDRFNNNPDNLEYLTNKEHSYKHTDLNSSETKKQQLRESNAAKLAEGTHPFQLMPAEVRAQNGRKNLTAFNKSERHKKAVSENNKRLVSEGKLSFQLKPMCAHTSKANEKRDQTCMERYGGTGFKSDIIQQKCRESCLRNNGYDNPFRSAEKQKQMRFTKFKKYMEKAYSYLGITENDSVSYIDLKCALYALNIHINSDIDFLNNLGYKVYDSGNDSNCFKKLRNKGECVRLFLKTHNSNKFTYEEFSEFYEDQVAISKTKKGCNLFHYRFKNKPTYEDIVKLGFHLYNHRVVKIEEVDSAEVFDLKLGKIHNFAIGAGIFVHNCGALFNASLHAEEYAYDYGESFEQLLQVNQDQGVSYDQYQLTTGLEEELKNLRGVLTSGSKSDRVHPSDFNPKISNYNLYSDIIIL